MKQTAISLTQEIVDDALLDAIICASALCSSDVNRACRCACFQSACKGQDQQSTSNTAEHK